MARNSSIEGEEKNPQSQVTVINLMFIRCAGRLSGP